MKRRHHRITGPLEPATILAHGTPLAERADTIAAFVLKHGPASIVFRRRAEMDADRTHGTLVMKGPKGASVRATITGYDGATGFRVLFPFGVAWGQAGKAWIPEDMMRDLLRDARTRVAGVKAKDLQR